MPTVSGIVVSTSAESTGRRTLADVVGELARPIDPDDSTVQDIAGDAFRASVRILNRKGNWPWEVMDEDITISANNAFSTATGVIKKPLAMHKLSASGGTRDERMRYVPYNVFIENYSLNYSTDPNVYTIPNLFETKQIRWAAMPTSTDYARFTYYRVTPAPRYLQEAIEIPDYAIEAYMAFAWHEFLKRLPVRQHPFPIQVAMVEKRLAFRELSAHVNDPGDSSRELSIGGM